MQFPNSSDAGQNQQSSSVQKMYSKDYSNLTLGFSCQKLGKSSDFLPKLQAFCMALEDIEHFLGDKGKIVWWCTLQASAENNYLY